LGNYILNPLPRKRGRVVGWGHSTAFAPIPARLSYSGGLGLGGRGVSGVVGVSVSALASGGGSVEAGAAIEKPHPSENVVAMRLAKSQARYVWGSEILMM